MFQPRFSLSLPALLLWRLALALLMLTLSRAAFYLYNADLLHIADTALLLRCFAGGLRFDLSALVYVNTLVIVLHLLPLPQLETPRAGRWITAIYFLCNFAALALNAFDTVFFRFTLCRTSYPILQEFAHENPLRFLRLFAQYWTVVLAVALAMGLWWAAYRAVAVRPAAAWTRRRYLQRGATLLLGVALALPAMRGRTWGGLRPLAPHNAALYCDEPQQQALVLNTPFTLIRTVKKESIKVRNYFPEPQPYFSAIARPAADSPFASRFRGRNVVLIIWESMAKEWVGALNSDTPDYPSYTPFIDSLLPRSYALTEAYACGVQSVDAMPALFSSITRPEQPFVTSPYSSHALSSLPEILRSEGYETAFFHNAENGSMGFDAFATKLRFHHYYGMNEYPDPAHFDGAWGIWDEEFLQFFARKIGTLRPPFFAVEFTTTSHDPFRIPARYEHRFPKGRIPIHATIGYTDYALRRFFDTARRQPWYENTLFVITADHAVAGVHPKYNNLAGRFSIPFIFYDPREEWIGTNATTFQQADFLPTLLDLLGLARPIVAFGNNVFSPTAPHFAVSSVQHTYQMIEGDYVLQFDGERVVGFYDKRRDPRLRRNLASRPPRQMQPMLLRLKGYLQEFTHRLTENRLRTP